MKHVKYTGTLPHLIGHTALMDDSGKVQLDGHVDNWRKPNNFKDRRCYGWHSLGTDWEEIK